MQRIVGALGLFGGVATLRRMWTLFGFDGSGSAAVEMALLRCAAPCPVQRALSWAPDSAQQELQRVDSQPDLAPVFARHWPG